MKIELIKYREQFNFGMSISWHNHHMPNMYHFHLWIEIGIFCVEITIGKDHY